MADEFPESLQQYAVPPASKNTAGQKSPIQNQPAAAPKAKRKAPVKAQAPKSGEPDIHDQLTMISGGTIKHAKSGESPYASGEAVPESSEVGQIQDPDIPEDFDPFTVDPPEPATRKMTAQEAALRKQAALAELGVRGQEAVPAIIPPDELLGEGLRRQVMATEPKAPGVPHGPQNLYLQKSQRIQLELADGTFTLPVIDVRESRLSVLLLLPLRDNATIFIPKPGTQMSLTYGKEGKNLKVYYPGSYVEIEELGAGFMTLIKAEAET